MSWIYRHADQHRCELPALDDDARPGDLWKCGCGKHYWVQEHQIDGMYLSEVPAGRLAGVLARAIAPREDPK